MSMLFGSLQKMKIPQVESDIDLEVVNSYTTDLSGIYTIITVDDKSTWCPCTFVCRCVVITRFFDTYYNIIVSSHMDSQG
jgi:hypothetical protein